MAELTGAIIAKETANNTLTPKLIKDSCVCLGFAIKIFAIHSIALPIALQASTKEEYAVFKGVITGLAHPSKNEKTSLKGLKNVALVKYAFEGRKGFNP